jgi:hypothetical protein
MVLIRARAFSFVLFISKLEQDAWLPMIKADISSYPTRFTRLLVSGAEICPSNGRRHVHVYVEFDAQKHNGQLDRFLHLTGVEKPFVKAANRGDYNRIRQDYTKIETKEDPEVLLLVDWPSKVTRERDEETDTQDERPIKKSKMQNHELRALVESGNIEAIKEWNYNFYLRNKGSIEAEAAKYRKKTYDLPKKHLWIVGKPQTGKSAITKYLWPDAYQKDLCNQNFEDYNNQEDVVLDDMDNKRLRLMTVGKLKNLCNPAGSQCKVNYGTVFVKARIIVTSNYSLKDCFKHKGKAKFTPNPDFVQDEEPIEQDVDYLAIKERFREVTIKNFLLENKLRLMTKEQIAELTTEQQGTYQIFEEYDAYTENSFNPDGRYGSSVTSDDRVTGTTDADQGVQQSKGAQAFVDTLNKPTEYTPCYDANCGKDGMMIAKKHVHWKVKEA